MPQIAIICSVIPVRHHLLLRSLPTWQRSIEESGLDGSIYIWSEGCDLTELLSKLPTMNNVLIAGQKEFSGSPELGSNFWVQELERTGFASMYCFTHPEIMFSTPVVTEINALAWKDTYVTFRPFWMPEHLTAHYDDYGFECPEDMEKCDDLYQFGPSPTPSRYLNVGIRENKNWQSDTTWAGNYDSIHDLFPLPVFGKWGPIDPYLAGARYRLGHKTIIPESCVYHQAHPRIEGGPPGYAVDEASKALSKRFGY